MADVFEAIANRVRALPPGRALVAVDGVDGSGKSVFASNLVEHIRSRPVVLLHADDFLNPVAIRLARGQNSPDAHWRDLYDYNAFRTLALDPLLRGRSGRYRMGSYDLETDSHVEVPEILAPDDALVVVEGLFLHRDELIHYWDMSIFLDVPFRETVRRMAVRDGTHPDPFHASMQRYVGGQRIYFERAEPWNRATIVVDNTSFENPRVITADGRHQQ